MTNSNLVSQKQCNFASFHLFATDDYIGSKMDHVTCRGASRGSVWLSWQTPLHCGYSPSKPIKY